MKPLFQQLLEILQSLQLAPGTPANALTDLLAAYAASIIQQDPAQANLPPDEIERVVEEAIGSGAELAASLIETNTRLRLIVEDLPLGTPASESGEVRAQVFGPFVERSGRLLRFVAFHSGAFQTVHAPGVIGAGIGEILLLIPAASTPDADDLKEWTLAPGTVWVQSRFVVAGATAFTGLRIAGGVLRIDPGAIRNGTALVVPLGGSWSLSVEPEPAPPANAAGSDAQALNLTLPSRLEVSSNAPPSTMGDAALSGFGSDLNFTFQGAPVVEGNQICFPMQVAEPQWSIAGNRSGMAQFSGESAVNASRWALPVTNMPTDQLGEAAHSGSIVVQLPGGFTSMFAGQSGGPSRCFVATLTANSRRIEIDALQPQSAARYDLDLWQTTTTSIRFAQQSILRLLFRSEREDYDVAVVIGGAIRNNWDLPRRADDSPFPFSATVTIFGLLANAVGSWLTCTANERIPDEFFGLALENLYLLVKSPRKLFLMAAFDQAPRLHTGIALLFFDVNFGLPTLPDPYASNTPTPDFQGITESALRVVLEWTQSQTPAVSAHLERQIPFLESRLSRSDNSDERNLYDAFRAHLGSQPDFLYLLDMSGREDLFGVAFEPISDGKTELIDNQLSVELRRVRLLMQPQVQWEPVLVQENYLVPTLKEEVVHSTSNGGPALVGANSVKLVPTIPGPLSNAIVGAIGQDLRAAALFSLPFGLRAMARLSPPDPQAAPIGPPPGASTTLHDVDFGELASARQIRIAANNTLPIYDPSRYIPGMLRQLSNLAANASGLSSVTPPELMSAIPAQFTNKIPLHHADLSGYGLTSFSQWVADLDQLGICQVHFRVLTGRTSYEVIQFRSILHECGARSVRTIILERHNSGRVFRYDSGWDAIEPGRFNRPKNYEKGSVQSFQNIRRIRIRGPVIVLDNNSAVQPVIFDADAEIVDRIGGGLVPFYDRPGYVQVQPPLAPGAPPPVLQAMTPLTEQQARKMFELVGPISGSIDCAVKVGGTLQTQIGSIVSNVSVQGGVIGFAVAIVGTPSLPRTGQWNVVRIDQKTGEVAAVDSRRGAPIVRVGNGPYRFLEPSDALVTNPATQYGFLMATATSRVLFRLPFLDPSPANVGTIQFTLPPLMADPYSLVQATGAFPRANFAIGLKEKALFNVDGDHSWRIDNPTFTIDSLPVPDLLKGAEWGLKRAYQMAPVQLDLDSLATIPLSLDVPESDLDLDLPQFPPALQGIFKIKGKYKTSSTGVPVLDDPKLLFAGALDELQKVLNSLSQLANLPVKLDVSVNAGGGMSPSFVVHMRLIFRIGGGPAERVDIGVGKFYGQFSVLGELEAALTGSSRALLALEFQGDVQQGIIPPLIYAGGMFRFSIAVNEAGRPTIQLTLGVVASIGGALIPKVVEVEVTVKYGYTLIPETLEPGVLLGLEARAKILSGLAGFSFNVEAMARIKRANTKEVTVWAQIRICATAQVAYFIEDDIDIETQFEQKIPLAALALVPGVGLLPAATAL